jgi:hypothetical protein
LTSAQTLETFIADWGETEIGNKTAFLELKEFLTNQTDVMLEFVPRDGVTYSLRAAHRNQKERSLFAMVDVIEDQPRWLSVCFYNEMVTDPEERGEYVPEGLLGEDALCFDVEAYDEGLQEYVKRRLTEAVTSASND